MCRYWLLKSEPGCFSFADLQGAPESTSSWDGVRNYQARNLLRDELQPGDGILFYHSNIPAPAIVGLAVVASRGYPDATALDPRAEHFDPRASVDNPIWFLVDVRALRPLPQPLTRDDLRRHPALAGMELLRKGSRLSVQPVRESEWRVVLNLAGVADPLQEI
ncbi:EVE domain-containing protein [Desulfuromonas carbonis]